MRRPFVAGNWKMHGSHESVAVLLADLKTVLANETALDIAVFPPYVFLDQAATSLANTTIKWGAQNMCSEPAGAYTGEIAAAMLQELDCTYVLLGHSERRTLFHETNEIIVKKLILAQQQGLVPILCVGETLAERDRGITEQVIQQQLQDTLALGPTVLEKLVIAYEPVWAIGTGKTASPAQAQAVHAFIRRQLAQVNVDAAIQLQILYGGSVKASNATELFGMADIDGALVGGASLVADEFVTICRAAKP